MLFNLKKTQNIFSNTDQHLKLLYRHV